MKARNIVWKGTPCADTLKYISDGADWLGYESIGDAGRVEFFDPASETWSSYGGDIPFEERIFKPETRYKFIFNGKSKEPSVKIVDKILDERGSRYGKFKDHADITQTLKRSAEHFLKVKHNTDLKNKLSASQHEALDMIFHKIGRILNGDPNYADSWVDIAGYAQLVVDELEGVSR